MERHRASGFGNRSERTSRTRDTSKSGAEVFQEQSTIGFGHRHACALQLTVATDIVVCSGHGDATSTRRDSQFGVTLTYRADQCGRSNTAARMAGILASVCSTA
jgi:hypothetical protein